MSVCRRDLAGASSAIGCRADGVWRFADALPRVSTSNRVTLAEGSTPLLDGAGLIPDHANLFVKDETRNPTGTFKDRILAIAASVACEVGARGLVCASTGNAGASTAAYAARAGLPAVIVVPSSAPAAKVAQASVCGAAVVRVPGSYSDAYRVARELEEAGYLNTTTTFVSPYSVEGGRTVAYELAEDMRDSPDWIVVPIGAGPLLVGIFHGFAELMTAGRCRSIPRLLAVQPEGCAPIVRAVTQHAERVEAWGTPDTLVSSLADPLQGYEKEGNITLEAIRASGGSAVAVSDADTLEWIKRLASGIGVFAEPGGATALAGAAHAVERGLLGAEESVVCCVTGTGLKDPLAALGRIEAQLLEPGSPEFERLFGQDDARVGDAVRTFVSIHPVSDRGWSGMPLIDLSLPLVSDMPRFDGTPPLYVGHSHRIETEGFRMCTVVMGNHIGTHLDAPSHFVPSGGTVDQIALERCMGPALVIDMSAKTAGDEITVADLERAVGDDLSAGDRLLIRTDWDEQAGNTGYFTDFVPLAEETAQWFVAMGLGLVGVDIPTLHQTEFAGMHEVMLGAEIVIVESLANLRMLTQRRVFYCGLPIKLMGADGAPVRAAAYDGLVAPTTKE